MTFRLVFGTDPGITGALAAIADGKVVSILDMPTRPRETGGQDEVNPSALASWVKEVRAAHIGAAELAVIENVQPMPSKKDGKGMGSVSAFQYGRTVNAPAIVFELLGVPLRRVHASRWKKDVGMPTKQQIEDDAQRKDYARTLVIQRHPSIADSLKRKKDCARAEAILMADWGLAEMVGESAIPKDPFDLTSRTDIAVAPATGGEEP